MMPPMHDVESKLMSTGAPIQRDLVDYLELIADISRDFATLRDLDATFKSALVRVTGLIGVEAASLFLVDPEDGYLICKACHGPVDITGIRLAPNKGIVGKCVSTGQVLMVRDVSQDPDFQNAVDQQTGFVTRSLLAAPLAVKDLKLGCIEVINKSGGDHLFGDDDVRVVQALAAAAALAIHNTRMAAALVDQERTKRELELAAEIQRSMLPDPQPWPFPVSGFSASARTVAGDFYDHYCLPDGRVYFAVGDVSGKGINAAMLMAKTASLFRCLGKTIEDPADLLGLINRELCETTKFGMFVTMAAGLYDPSKDQVRLAMAGHEPALLIRRGEPTDIESPDQPLGIFEDIGTDGRLDTLTIDLDGGALYFFSDGVTEGLLSNGQRLGRDGVVAHLSSWSDETLDKRVEALAARLIRKGETLFDDLTILAIENRNRKGRP